MSRRRAFSVVAVAIVATGAFVVIGSVGPPTPGAVVAATSAVHRTVEPRVSTPLPPTLRVRAAPPLRVVRQAHGPSRIAGIVRRTDGTPAPAVLLAYFALPSGPGQGDTPGDDEDPVDVSSVTTESDGSFSIEVGPGDYGVYAIDESRASQVLSPISVSPGESVTELEVVLDGPSVLGGVVVQSDGDPVPATVRVSLAEPRVYLVAKLTGRDGRFLVPHLPNAPLHVWVMALGDLEGRRELPHPVEDVVVRVSAAQGTLVCEVVDWNGVAVSDVQLAVTQRHRGIFTSTDVDGRARVTGLHGRVQVSVEGARGAAETITVLVDGTEQLVRIRLEHAATITGRVLDHDGNPASGTLSLAGDHGDARSVTLDEGVYSIDAVRAGRYTLAYGPSGVADPSTSLVFSSNGSDDLTLPDLRLPASRVIHGRVVDEEGDPVAGAGLDVMSLSDGSFDSLPIDTDDEGRFEIEAFGRTRLRASHDGATSAPLVLSGGGDEEATLTLERAGELEGIVRGVSRDAEVRCADGVWHPIAASGQYQLTCGATATLEVRDGGTARTFAVDYDPDETTYAEIKW